MYAALLLKIKKILIKSLSFIQKRSIRTKEKENSCNNVRINKFHLKIFKAK